MPANLERFQYENIKERPLVIGWVENSKRNKKTEDSIDYKGLETILKVAVDELIKEGISIKTIYADANEKYRDAKAMQEYYGMIDIYVCVSLMEGTPRPVLEALSCGVPIITTDVGVVDEVLGPKQKQFILKERTVKEVKQKILKLYQKRELFEELSEENREQGMKNSSKTTVKQYEDFFTF